LGYDANEPFSQKKIIEVMRFTKSGAPFFGARIFNEKKDDKNPKARRIFEYSKQVSMTLRFDEKTNMIAFDHLIPTKPENKGLFFDYVPDLSYDGYQWEGGKWVFKSNVMFTNPADADKPFIIPDKSGLNQPKKTEPKPKRYNNRNEYAPEP
jgi:hypothetical protein